MPPGRPTEGRISKKNSDTALFTYVASRLAGAGDKDYEAFRQRLGVSVARSDAAAASRPYRLLAEQSLRPADAPLAVIHPWVSVDERSLGLGVALVRIAFEGKNPRSTVQALRSTPGVRQVIETARGEVLAIALYRTPRDQLELWTHVRSIAPTGAFLWDEVMFESSDSALRTWEKLTKQAATHEQLAETDDPTDLPSG
jgi:hypothetical protein